MLNNRNEIKVWLDDCKIYNYTLHNDLTVDVNGNVDISSRGLTEIPVQFGLITGHFSCDNNQLISLEGGPQTVRGDFFCYNNPIENFQYLNFEVGEQIIFTPNEEINYLNEFKDGEGNIRVDFQLLKTIIKSHKINSTLHDELNHGKTITPKN